MSDQWSSPLCTRVPRKNNILTNFDHYLWGWFLFCAWMTWKWSIASLFYLLCLSTCTLSWSPLEAATTTTTMIWTAATSNTTSMSVASSKATNNYVGVLFECICVCGILWIYICEPTWEASDACRILHTIFRTCIKKKKNTPKIHREYKARERERKTERERERER